MSIVRPLAQGDKGDWLRLWAGYQTFYQVQIPAHTTELTWHRLLDHATPMEGLLAIEGERAVGLTHTVRHASTWSGPDYCYLHDLYVEPERRGRGIGRQLIEQVYRDAEAKGCARVYWLTHETNATAQALYDKMAERSGFIHYWKLLPHHSMASAQYEAGG